MKFSLEFLKETEPRTDIRVGDLYPAKTTGPKGRLGTKYFLVASITKSKSGNRAVHMLGLDENGEIVSTTSYGAHAIEGFLTLWPPRKRLGVCKEWADLSLRIYWEK